MSIKLMRAGLGILFLTIALVTACDRPGDTASVAATFTNTSDPVIHPYQPRRDLWDVAVSIDDPVLLMAASRAAESQAILERAYDFESDVDEMKSRLVAAASDAAELYESGPVFSSTGGLTHRAVGVTRTDDTTVQVTVCTYAVPGLYVRGPDGGLQLQTGASRDWHRAWEVAMVWTSGPDALGETSDQPRWLRGETTVNRDSTIVATACELGPCPRVLDTLNPGISLGEAR